MRSLLFAALVLLRMDADGFNRWRTSWTPKDLHQPRQAW